MELNCLRTVAHVFAVSPRPAGSDHISSVQNLGLPQCELPLAPSSGPCSLFVHTSMIPHVTPQSCSFIHLLDTQIKTTWSLPIRSSEEQSFPTSLSPVSSAQPPPVLTRQLLLLLASSDCLKTNKQTNKLFLMLNWKNWENPSKCEVNVCCVYQLSFTVDCSLVCFVIWGL